MDDVRSTCASAGSLSHFPAQWGPACHPTLPGGEGGQGVGFARAGKGQMDRFTE